MYMDLGSFWGFFEPILKDIGDKVTPIAPFIDSLTAPVPVVSDISQKTGQAPITVYDLLEVGLARARSAAKTDGQAKAADMVRTFLTLMKTIDGLGGLKEPAPGIMGFGEVSSGTGLGSNAGVRGSGGFKVDTTGLTGTCGATVDGERLPKDCTRTTTRATKGIGSGTFGQSGNAVSKTETVKQLDDCKEKCTGKELSQTVTKRTTSGLTGYGLPTMPFLSSANEVYGMLLGGEADLVHMDFGVLHATSAFSMSLGPFMAGPLPVAIDSL